MSKKNSQKYELTINCTYGPSTVQIKHLITSSIILQTQQIYYLFIKPSKYVRHFLS